MKTSSTIDSVDLRKADEICTINLFLTKHIFGEKVKNLYSVTANSVDATKSLWNAVEKFKDDNSSSTEFRVAPYNRILYDGPSCPLDKLVPGHKFAIDFGDYGMFLMVEVLDAK